MAKNKIPFFEFIKTLNKIGVGEIVLNSIDRDGLMKGYDIDTIKKFDKFRYPVNCFRRCRFVFRY